VADDRDRHPPRPSRRDVARYTAAANAYAQLRTPWGRSEAYADLTSAQAYVPAPAASLPAAPGIGIWRAARVIPARIRQGRPLRLLARAVTAAALSLVVLHAVPGQPSGPAVVTGLITWFVLTARGDLAPPPGR
jgi:hypothetical protein